MQTMANRFLIAAKSQVERLLRWAFYFLLLLILIPSGSVNFIPFHRISAGLFIVAALAAVLSGPGRLVRAPHGLALGLAVVLGAWILFQGATFGQNAFGNPIWADAQRIYGAMPTSISVTPGDTTEGLLTALLPFAIFITTLVLFRSDSLALGLIRAIVLCGIGICIFGLIQFSFFPNMLVFETKRFYLRSLTTVFVNRNTAATYIGMVLIFSVGFAIHYLQNAGLRSFIGFLTKGASKTRGADACLFVFFALASVAAFVALMLTQSRAGIASSLLGLGLLIAVTVYSGNPFQSRGTRYGFAAKRESLWLRLGRISLVFAGVGVLGFLFAGLAMFRVAVQGTNDLRFCFFPRVIEIAKDNWLVGTGFGTFRDVYPSYRDPACGMDGVLLLAHNFYLEGMISLGLPFAVVCMIALVALFSHFIPGIRNRRQFRWVPAAGLSVLIVHILHNSVDFSIQNPGVAAVFAALMGAAVVVARGRQSGSSKRSPVATPPASALPPASSAQEARPLQSTDPSAAIESLFTDSRVEMKS